MHAEQRSFARYRDNAGTALLRSTRTANDALSYRLRELMPLLLMRPLFSSSILSFLFLVSCQSGLQPNAHLTTPPSGSKADLAVLETTDLHSNVLSYDYFKLAEDKTLGFERLATLIRQARKEFTNTVLFDAGDTIQGTALADYQAIIKPLACDHELGMYKAMQTLGYDAGTIGNHEFNYGLDFLSRATGQAMHIQGIAEQHCHGPNYPLVLANVISLKTHEPIFAPYRIIEKILRVTAPDGTSHQAPLRIGILGLTPPGIMNWDRNNLAGKVIVNGMLEAAQQYVPKLRAAGADLVIVISHAGIDISPYSESMENANWHVAKVPGIDVLLMGHSHDIFPDPGNAKSRYAHVPEVDNERGTICGVPAVMGNFWGKSLGVVNLALHYEQGHWLVDREHTHSEVRSIKNVDGSFVAADPTIAHTIAKEHEQTLAYVKSPIGQSDFRITSYFALVGDVATTQIINMAQHDYVERYLHTSLPQYANLPLLSTASAFKTGFGGATDYTDIPAGPLAIRNAVDLYFYPNTLAVVKINGAELKAWLEHSAKVFSRIDPTKTEPQSLLNSKYPLYNFDVLQGGVSYEIDISQPLGQRIRNLHYQSHDIDPSQDFIVVTNSYRANGGGTFPGLDGSKTIFAAPDTNRDILIEYIRAKRELRRADVAADRNWHFAKLKTTGMVTFVSAINQLEAARAAGLDNITQLKDEGEGKATYALDLSR